MAAGNVYKTLTSSTGTDVTHEDSELFSGHKDVTSYAQQTLGQLMKATRASHTLPAAGDDYDFYSSYDSFREFCNDQGNHVLQSINRLIRQQGVKGQLQPGGSTVSLDDKMDIIIETNDNVLERVGTLLDEASGITTPKQSVLPPGSKPELMVASWNRKRKLESGLTESRSFHMMHAKHIARPQLKFKDKVDNTNLPFIPIIRHKPNALKPLDASSPVTTPSKADGNTPQALVDFIQQQRKGQGKDNTQSNIIQHPYQYELDHLEPTPSQLQPTEPPKPRLVKDTPLTLVDTEEELGKLSRELKSLTEFAVDLEHHSYRSFLGFTCLMQISTAMHDYIVDTLELRSELHILNESFTDPKIVKVFHGAHSDIEWLQRDFGLYVVNMFDTGQASRTLGLARHSLGHLLQVYCHVETDKKYQLADWRIRPLPTEMMKYAREDTHYLLYIYHTMKKQLLAKGNEHQNLLRMVLDRSRDICLKRYIKPVFTDESYMILFRKNRKAFNKQQLQAFKLMYAWRDGVARAEDESPGYVLPNHMLFHISEQLPRESHGVLACCTPIPPLVKQHLNQVHQLIIRAKLLPSNKSTPVTEPKTPTQTKPKQQTFSTPTAKNPLESLTLCPHDGLQSVRRETDEGPSVCIAATATMFSDDSNVRIPPVRIATPVITLFLSTANAKPSADTMSEAQKKAATIKASLANPFEMYLPTSKPSQIASSLLDADKISLSEKRKSTHGIPSNPMEVVWKLKPFTEPKKKLFSTHAASSSPHKWTKPVTARAPDILHMADEEEEEDVPLRHQGAPSKKRKPSNDTEQPKPKKERLTEDLPDTNQASQGEGQFEAYDYTKADLNQFEGALKQGHGKKVHWDSSSSERGQNKNPTKSRNHPASGIRSMVYGQSGPGRKGGGQEGGWRGGGGGRGRGGGRGGHGRGSGRGGHGRGSGRGGFRGGSRGGRHQHRGSNR